MEEEFSPATKQYDRNTYYVLALPEAALEAILEHCVGDLATTRKNIAGNKAVVKLPVDAPVPGVLTGKTPLTHSDVKVELAKAEWNPDELL